MFVLALYSAGVFIPGEIEAITKTRSKSEKKKGKAKRKNRQGCPGPKGPKGDPGPRGPAGSVAIEYMNLSNPLSDDILEYDLTPFSFSFPDRSPNTKSISYIDDERDPHIVLQPGMYWVSYDLRCSFGITCLRNQITSLPQFPFDAGTGWTVELAATRQNTIKSEMSFKKCTTPIYGGCLSRDSNKKNAEKQHVYLSPLTLAISHSQVVEVPSGDGEWFLRLKSVDYPLAAGILPRLDAECGSFPYKLFFFGNNSSSASPINLSILKIGEPS